MARRGCCPSDRCEHDAFAHTVELFASPHKFAFVDLPKLGTLAAAEFELHFTFDCPPKLARPPTREDIRLHCVPVVNLFPCSADPVRFKPLQPESLVRAAEHSPTDVEVYEVRSVIGVGGGHRIPYPAFTSFRCGEAANSRYWVTRRVPSVTDSGTDMYISLALAPRRASHLGARNPARSTSRAATAAWLRR